MPAVSAEALEAITADIHSTQVQAAANREPIALSGRMGVAILAWQATAGRGSRVLDRRAGAPQGV